MEFSRQFPGAGVTAVVENEPGVPMGLLDMLGDQEIKRAFFLPGMYKSPDYPWHKEEQMVPLGEAVPEGQRQPKDPHVWLGIPEAILMVERIRDVLGQVDPAHKELYRANAAAYAQKLMELDKSLEQEIARYRDAAHIPHKP